jgi:hypothetical protein
MRLPALLALLAIALALPAIAHAAINAWTLLGLEGREVRQILIAPTNLSTLYARTSHNGVFKTVDAGATWQEINTGLHLCFSPDACKEDYLQGLSVIAISRTNSNVLYAAVHSNIYRSANGGATRDKVNSPASYTSIPDLAIDPQ